MGARSFQYIVATLTCGMAVTAEVGAALSMIEASRAWLAADEWQTWIEHLGHDTYTYPPWISVQMNRCHCRHASQRVVCFADSSLVSWRTALESNGPLDFCTAKAWLLDHMPPFDLHFLPGSITANASSMLDDNIAFSLMADRAAPWSSTIPLATKLAYLLPYAGYHESRQNWRPLFFAKFFGIVANATSVEEAISRLIAPNVFTEWAQHYWPSSPRQFQTGADAYQIDWSSSTAPPVVGPLDFVAYGYGSCSAWATFLTYTLRSVGLAARQVGTPCWNSVYAGRDFRGLASVNANVSLCWSAGSSKLGHGGGFLNNHNWVEVYVPASSTGASSWSFINVPPGTKTLDGGLCGDFDSLRGCGYDKTEPAGHECDSVDGGPGAAMRDHEIFAITWDLAGEHDYAFEGGEIVDVAQLTLSTGEPVSPLVWSAALASPLGERLASTGLRVVNRTDHYRCKPTA